MIEFDINDTSLQEYLHSWMTVDLTPLLEDIGGRLVDSVHETIDTEGHGNWEPPAADYGHPLLRDTDALYDSINYSVQGDTVTVDHNVAYGDYQNTGTSRIPARPFLVMQEADMAMAEEMLAQFFS